MRKFVACMMAFLLLTASAQALELELKSETWDNAELIYPFCEEETVNAALEEALGLAQTRALMAGGAQARGETWLHAFSLPDGRRFASLCCTVKGNIHFGRYGSETHTALLELDSGEITGLEAVFPDLDGLGQWLDAYVEAHVLESINTYMDAGELLPVPLDAACLDGQGLTIHYPAERFRAFSGESGAVQINYAEMIALLPQGLYASPDREAVFAAAAQGTLPGVALCAGDSLHEAIADYGAVNEPDYIAGGEIYSFEAAALRGVTALAERGAETDDAALITGVRSVRFDLGGIVPGDSLAAARAALGEPEASVALDAAAAEEMRLLPGGADIYPAGAYTLTLYYDDTDACGVYAVQVSR